MILGQELDYYVTLLIKDQRGSVCEWKCIIRIKPSFRMKGVRGIFSIFSIFKANFDVSFVFLFFVMLWENVLECRDEYFS